MSARMFSVQCLFMLWSVIWANDPHKGFKVTIIAHKSLDRTTIIEQYVDERDGDIVLLPLTLDTNNMCDELQSLFADKNTLSESTHSQYILFVDLSQNVMSFSGECKGNNMEFDIIKNNILSNDALVLIQVTMREKEREKHSRALLNTEDTSLGTWVQGTSTLPAANRNMATFLYNNTIYLFGGPFSSRNKQIIVFHPSTQSFTDLGDVLSVSCEGEGPFYTQLGAMAYWTGSTSISRYDLSTKQLFANEISGVNNTMKESCLTSHNNLLFVIGGSYDTKTGFYPPLRKVQVYDLFVDTWLDGVPAMIRPRTLLTCAVHPQYNMLYAIGGSNRLYSTLDYEVIVEKIGITGGILNNVWEETKDHLPIGVIQAQSVVYQQYIVVMGGHCYYYPRDICPGEVDAVQLINVVTDEVTFGPSLKSANEQFGTIYNPNDHRIYVFGGYSKDTYSYLKLKTPTKSPTISPTIPPTVSPTNSPTRLPTRLPTISPTRLPTVSPTISPTRLPTISPTRLPTVSPTVLPSASPTVDPTYRPTTSPTKSPSTAPTNNPTFLPTNIPTVNPTNDPTARPTATPTVNPAKTVTKRPTTTPLSNTITESPSAPMAPSHDVTLSPTSNQSVAPSVASTLSITDKPGNVDGHNRKKVDKTRNNIILIVAFALLFVTFFILWVKKRKELNELRASMHSDADNGGPYIALNDPDSHQL